MSYSIKDRLDFQMSVGGQQVDMEQNMLDFFHVVESVRLYVPMMTIRFKDINKFFTRNELLVDGAPIVVSVAVEQKKTIYPFRLFSHKSILSGGVTTYTLHAYLDVPRYWTESIDTPLMDTASGVLATLCSQSGMTYEGVSTNDKQIWIPQNKRRAEFAKYLVQHSYIDDQSCCQMGVLIDKRMRMVNTSVFNTFPVKEAFSNSESQSQQVITDFNMLNRSGFFNALTGYKAQQVVQSVMKDDEILDKLDVKKNSRHLSMSSLLSQSIGQNKVSFSPIDTGNVNDNYEKARYQNDRLSNLFTFGVEFVTPRLVASNLLDVITCDLSSPGAASVTSMSGKYMMTSKIAYIENMNFYQKVEAYRQGNNSSRDNSQL